MTRKEYGEYIYSLYLKDEITFGQGINMAMARAKEDTVKAVIEYLRTNLTPFDWCIGHTEHNEIVMNTERFIKELKRHLDYYGE